MTMPTSLCPNCMQVHSIRQETSDVWTIFLINHDFYPYQPGQFALVSIDGSNEVLRAYTLSSSPGLSRFISITVRRLEQGVGSVWLTTKVKPGDYLWLSDAQGEFTCANYIDNHYLMLAAGCGVTPVMSMCRWLLHHRPQADMKVIFNVRDSQQVIFADEWRQLVVRYPTQLQFIIMVEQPEKGSLNNGRLTEEKLATLVPDISCRTVMACGPAPYMKNAREFCYGLGVAENRFFMERFFAEPEQSDKSHLTMALNQSVSRFKVPVGITLLAAMENNYIPVMAACRAGVCGSCKTRVISGEYTTRSTMTLTANEIANGCVLACSCQLWGDVVLE
ncbi:HCP oxidoreductase [Photorhabdus heterorhabditis]|uniref:HCP oxidoreductase n=1 Tax=Photorhabdus heterorhabditis TaxID=880156 RepID=A0ABR5K971_9GAMM|nr:NADH oxidoreductase [Photorhabdus heterorhabditis]KOY61135.1 HCP oxidoreductase [Photorhabdus heterorhabditis]